MGILSVYHPDILDFITSKAQEGFLDNFNISVVVDDQFMEAADRGEEYYLVNPRNGRQIRKLNARLVFDLIANMAWKTGDPGLIFLDEINRHNPTPKIGRIESTNPCGEQPLLPYESCNLGSINLSNVVGKGDVDWEKLRELVRLSVHFLDNVIDANRFPLPEIERMTKGNRKIGLGIMGWADVLAKLKVAYDSEEALSLGEKVMAFISDGARKASVELAAERGSFPNFQGSLWEERGFEAMRNATVTTVAPTGTISIIAGVTSGIEPFFAMSYVRNILDGSKILETNPTFEAVARERGFYSRNLVMEAARKGSLKDVDGVPEDVKRIFVTSFDIAPEWHVRMQAAFQKHADNGVSKTVNLPSEATVEDVRKTYWLAYKLKCKGITVYRYGSKSKQVLTFTPMEPQPLTSEPILAEPEYSGGCLTPLECAF